MVMMVCGHRREIATIADGAATVTCHVTAHVLLTGSDAFDWSSIVHPTPNRSADPLFQTPVHERFVRMRSFKDALAMNE
ncbi:hypothetical protein PTKU64_86440 [Paraburkholderia terrae]|uniref:Uncharacterized protein n=1 Tax=Paraburkholderia terrae TaxID=311230 RepID=A0ABM7U1G8_9BURK|nr:hypothetical protein PTKU64_86440 [Paraburkholderia terrae]BDC44931.1 hypothetical protein PTKU15_82280 [Paraburkholderia terrae]